MSNEQSHNQKNLEELQQYLPAELADYINNFDGGDFDDEMFECDDTNMFDEGYLAMVADYIRGNNHTATGLEASRPRIEDILAQSGNSHIGKAPRRKSKYFNVDAPARTYQFLENSSHSQPQMQQVPALQVSTETIPSKPISGLHFANRAEAYQAFSHRKVQWSWTAPQNDDTIPQNQYDCEKYVLNLLAAFKDTSSCQESSAAISYEERWANIANGQSLYTPEQIEAVCWKLLETAIQLHQHGPSILRIFDTGKLEIIRKSRNLFFAARMQLVCDLLRLSKSRCESLLGFEDIEMTVSAPAQSINMAKTNKKMNKKRQELLNKGREARNAADNTVCPADVDDVKAVPVPAIVAQQEPPLRRAPANLRSQSHHAILKHQVKPVGGAYGNTAPENVYHGHTLQPGLQSALHRYPEPTVKQHTSANPEFFVGNQRSGKNKRRYDEYDDSQDDVQPYENKRMR